MPLTGFISGFTEIMKHETNQSNATGAVIAIKKTLPFDKFWF